MLQESGMPVTEEAMQAEWKRINEEQGNNIANDSAYSPFWRLIESIITKPCIWLRDLLIETALPNLFLKYASGVWLDMYAWGVNLKRKLEAYAIGELTVTRNNSAGELFIPKGFIVTSPKLRGYVYRVITTEDITIPDGKLTARIPVQAERPGTAYNLGAGYYSTMPKPVSGIASIKNDTDWLTVIGADKEQDEPLRLRCRNQFSAVGKYHHDAAYTSDITDFSGLRTDYLFFEHGAPRGPGSANCYIMIESGVPTQAFVDKINSYIRDAGHHGHGDDMLCLPIPVMHVALEVTVFPIANLSKERCERLKQDVENMVRCAFRENTDFTVSKVSPFSRFSFSMLSNELHAALLDLESVQFSHSGSSEDIISTMSLPLLNSLNVVEG